MTEGAGNQKSQERINYKTPEGIEVEVPIIRAGRPSRTSWRRAPWK